MVKLKISSLLIIIVGIFCFGVFPFVFASSTDGTIDPTYKYAWGENIGWLNFGADNSTVHVTDSGLSGYALGENIGWIYLGGIINNGEGTLSGYAWAENAGWLKFNPTYGGVIINSSGEFTGWALGENIGWIVFNCSTSACVKTDWRPISSRTSPTPTPTGPIGGGQSHPPKPPEPEKPTLVQEVIDRIREETQRISERAREIAEQIARVFLPIRPPITEEIKPPEVPIEELMPKEAPLSMQGKWQLLPPKPIRDFVLAPLPKEIIALIEKFPELGKTFEKLGITKITDIERLKETKLSLPGLTQTLGLPQGMPIAQLSKESKEKISSEIVFAKTGKELIDFNISLTITEKGEVRQKITTLSNKPLQLSVKPEKPVKSVKGYVVFRSKPQKTELELPQNSLLASLIFAFPVFAKEHNPTEIETRLVLLEFEYQDPDADGIYTAEIQAPVVEGEYEIITVMDYEDLALGPEGEPSVPYGVKMKEIRLIVVVDPEGYVFTQMANGIKGRIPGAIVSLYWLNRETKQYQLWPAKEYQQENPQVTDDTGKYSFLVPPGMYYLKIEAPSYLSYEGEPFEVKEGGGIHINIELKSKQWWLRILSWEKILLIFLTIIVFTLAFFLLYNFYRDKMDRIKK